jgi:diaminopimelate dehydrogenase
MNMKKLLAILLIIAMTFAFAACGNGNGSQEEDQGASDEPMVYKVAMEPTFPPFDTIDVDTQELAGFDVDLMNAIAEDQGFELEWINMGFDGLIPALQAGNIDIIASGMNASEERRQKVDFSTTYYDSGLVSINRIYAEAILPYGKTYTFWGKGISQGHSDAIRRVKGVTNAKQYTIPLDSAIEAVKRGEQPELSAREKHKRVCYVVADEGADKAQIENDIKTMPNYFSDYDTDVHFISEEELEKDHSGLPHGGIILHYGKTGLNEEHNHTIEYKLNLDSNPEFTANVLLAYARAAYRLNKEGITGAKTVADIAPAYLSIKSGEEIRKLFI